MASMKDSVVNDLKSRAAVFGWRMMQLQPFQMTHQECLDLICPSYHHEMLWNAAKVADISAGQEDMKVMIPHTIDGVLDPYFDFRMRTHEGREPPLRPRAPTWGSCDPAIHRKVLAWTNHHLVVGRQTATCKWVLGKLVEMCDTGHQIRYLWPAVLHLCAGSGNEETQKWVDKFGVRVAPRSLPKITSAFRKLLGDTSEWCAQAVLLADIPAIQQTEVVISHNTCYSFVLQLEGLEVALPRDII